MPAFRNRVLSLAACLLPLAACARAPQPAAPAPAGSGAEQQARAYGPQVVEGLARVRAATAAFTHLDSAVAVGYNRDVPRCYADPHHGAMGFHHVNRGYWDGTLDLEKPEILLYERRADGSYALNGVEYIVPYTRWPQDSIPPKLMGLTMNREDNSRYWYLHMWAWNDNSAGLFADWNPAVRCPEGTVR